MNNKNFWQITLKYLFNNVQCVQCGKCVVDGTNLCNKHKDYDEDLKEEFESFAGPSREQIGN